MKFSFSIIIVSIFLISCQKDEPPWPNPADYTDAITFFEALDYSGSVLISKNGTDVLRTGFKEANRITGEPNTAHTKFRIGSVSKSFTGMGIIQLLRDSLITNLEQPISNFFADFPKGNQISIKQLLSHQSGIPDYVPMVEDAARNGQTFTPEDIYEILKASVENNGLSFTPGEQMVYSNSNYLLAAMLIEQLSGVSYEKYLQTHLFAPLQMSETEPGSNSIPNQDYAQGYRESVNVSNYPINIAFGAGSWTSTVTDLEKWCQAAMGDTWFSGEEKTLIFADSVPEGYTSFGLGWFTITINNKTFYWHGGDIDGFSALIGFIPENKGIIITLSNEQDDTGMIRNLIIETLLKNEF